MQSDNHIRIAAFLNTFSTGTLIFHKPGKDFFYYGTFVCIPGTSFALLSRSKEVEWKAEEKEYFSLSLPGLFFLESFLFSAQNGQVLMDKSGLCRESGSNLQTMLLTQALLHRSSPLPLPASSYTVRNPGRKSSQQRKQQYPISALPASVKSTLRVHRKW